MSVHCIHAQLVEIQDAMLDKYYNVSKLSHSCPASTPYRRGNCGYQNPQDDYYRIASYAITENRGKPRRKTRDFGESVPSQSGEQPRPRHVTSYVVRISTRSKMGRHKLPEGCNYWHIPKSDSSYLHVLRSGTFLVRPQSHLTHMHT